MSRLCLAGRRAVRPMSFGVHRGPLQRRRKAMNRQPCKLLERTRLGTPSCAVRDHRKGSAEARELLRRAVRWEFGTGDASTEAVTERGNYGSWTRARPAERSTAVSAAERPTWGRVLFYVSVPRSKSRSRRLRGSAGSSRYAPEGTHTWIPGGRRSLVVGQFNRDQELAVSADPDRSLRHSKRHQLRIAHKRRPTRPRRDPVLVSEDVARKNKGFQIRHLELLSREDTWSQSPSSRKRGSLPTRAVSHQASSPRPPNIRARAPGERR